MPSSLFTSQKTPSQQAPLSAKAMFCEELRNAKARPFLLDGALGTELERRGVRSELPLWSAHALWEAPDVVRKIHREYLAAGAEILTTNTFRTQRRTLARGKLETHARELSTLAVSLARDAIREHLAALQVGTKANDPLPRNRTCLVLGSNPPLEDCFRPELVPDEETLDREHRENIETLLAGGADGILIETMNSIREAVAATRAAQSFGAIALVSFCATENGTLLSGENLTDAIDAIAPYEPHAVLVNCLMPKAVRVCLPALQSAKIPFGVYANNLAIAKTSTTTEALSPSAYANEAKDWIEAGARMVGGCCGTTPAHIEKLASLLSGAS